MMNKRIFVLAIGTGLVLAGGWTLADITGSKHDFSDEPWAAGDKCGACHTPHHEDEPEAAPLWQPNADMDQTFGVGMGEDRLGAGTVSCLRCHDGTVAEDTGMGGVVDRLSSMQRRQVWRTAHGVSNHPVGIEYPNIIAQDYHPVNVVEAKGIELPDGRLECISCHDPHNDKNLPYMLTMSNSGSGMCLTCHNK